MVCLCIRFHSLRERKMILSPIYFNIDAYIQLIDIILICAVLVYIIIILRAYIYY